MSFFFYCGGLGEVRFPFTVLSHPECGLLMLDNCNETFQRVKLGKDESWFNISDISQDDKMTLQEQVRLVDERVLPDNHSCEYFKNVTINSYPFISFELLANQVFFRCPANHSIHQNLGFSCNDSKISFLYPDTHSPNHSHINLPSAPAQCSQVPSVQNKTEKGGQCQSDSRGRFHCSDTKSGDGKLILKLVIVLGTTAGIGTLIVAFYFRRKIFSSYMFFWRNVTENDKKIQEFLRNYESFAPKRYRYSDIKKMTNSFRHKIGQGGYGVVYKGRLPDGRNVAVKVLVESKGNGEEFINEVASISRTSHVNIVSLSGFCFEGRKRALIYEFVANGSLEKFIYTKNQLKKDHQLNWETLNRIALGIARGLEYLHRGCSTRILHFDIKPHNILLDEDFCPKISDFGLAKVCPRKESIVSMIGARGTIGYIAPEVVSRNFGEVSHKSDVFSYGMMVLEMVGGRRNFDVRVDNTSEIYFPHWIYQRLKVDEELGLQDISNDEDKERARKMIIVSLWCIQANPSDRPTISTVVEMLEGSLVSLQIPPKPFLYSPRSQAESFKLLIDSSI